MRLTIETLDGQKLLIDSVSDAERIQVCASKYPDESSFESDTWVQFTETDEHINVTVSDHIDPILGKDMRSAAMRFLRENRPKFTDIMFASGYNHAIAVLAQESR